MYLHRHSDQIDKKWTPQQSMGLAYQAQQQQQQNQFGSPQNIAQQQQAFRGDRPKMDRVSNIILFCYISM
jgi:hypothetical protein